MVITSGALAYGTYLVCKQIGQWIEEAKDNRKNNKKK